MSEQEAQVLRVELPETVAGIQHIARLSTDLNGQVQEYGLTADDISLLEDGAVRTARTIARGADSTDSLMGFDIERTKNDRNVYRFRYQRPIHLAEVRDGNFYERQDTVKVGPILEGQIRDKEGRASEIVLFDVRKFS